MNEYDVIIVGGGNGGLATAAYTSKAGLKTLLFEKHNIPGGAVTSFRRGRFEFEPSLHELCEVGSVDKPGPTRELFNQMESDAEFIYENTLYRLISLDPEEKIDITVTTDLEKFYHDLDQITPGCSDNVRRFFEIANDSMDESERMNLRKIRIQDISSICNTFRMVGHSANAVMDELKIPKNIQHILTPYWTYIGEPTDTCNAFMLGLMNCSYFKYGAGVPTMFSHQLSLSIDKSIRKNNGKIFYNSPVTKILVKNKRAYGVIANGKKYYAKNIVCNCFPEDVFGHLIHRLRVPLFELHKSNARQPAFSFINVYLGLNKSVEQLGIKDYTTFIVEKADSKLQWNGCYGLGSTTWMIANALNIIVPECSPKGTTHFSLTTAVIGDEWSKLSPSEYKKNKLIMAEKMIDAYEKATGIKIRENIEEIEVATPVTFSRYLGTPNGTPYGYQRRNWDGIFLKTMHSLKEETLSHLYFVGAHTEEGDGYNQTYKSGRRIAERIIKRTKK